MITSVTNTAVRSTPPARADAAALFEQLDSADKGSLSAADFSSAVVEISAQGTDLSRQAAKPDAQTAFAAMDADQDGQLTAAEFEQGAEQAAASADSVAAGSADGTKAAPAGGPPRAAGGSQAAEEEEATTFEAADANEDGTVTALEQLAYDAEQARASAARSGQRESSAAVKAYEVVSRITEAA